MPNWCEGTIKFRGKREDIIRAMTEGLQPCDGEDGNIVFIKNHSDDNCLYFRATRGDLFWIEDTRRHFVGYTNEIYAYKYGKEFIAAMPFRAAWCIIASTDREYDGLDNFAMKYHVDIRATGFEQGMGFKQIVEVDRYGDCVMDLIDNYGHDYARYMWECEMPMLGG